MGGTVGVTIRRADGREHRMARWTNPLGHLFLNLDFIEGEDSFFDEYISMWDDMREDWLTNHLTGKYRHNEHPCAADSGPSRNRVASTRCPCCANWRPQASMR